MYKVESSHGRHLPSACGLHMHKGSHECVHMRAKILIKIKKIFRSYKVTITLRRSNHLADLHKVDYLRSETRSQ